MNQIFGVPKGIRTPVAAVKGQCPRPTRRWGPRSNAANHINNDDHVNILKMVRPPGLEPGAHGLKVRYSTN